MATWVELRCERRGETPAKWSMERGQEQCWSDVNEGPQQMASDTAESVRRTLKDLASEARDLGWKKTKGGWVCPYCLTHNYK